MNDVELARTLSWRENALFAEREKKVCLLVKNTPCLNTANLLDKCCNKGKRVANALGVYCLQIAWLDIILSVKFVFLRI